MLVYMFVQKKYLVKRSRAFMWIITLNFINTAFDIFASNLLNYIIADPSLKDKYLLLAKEITPEKRSILEPHPCSITRSGPCPSSM